MTPEKFALLLTGACRVAPGSRVLAAVSGGADSVALLRLLAQAAGPLELRVFCAHVEHGIRGEAALEDAAFVGALCAKLGVPFRLVHVDAPACAKARGCGLEEAARALRYAALDGMADELGTDCVALAHHLRDQAETVLLRAARGSDLRGLCAMRERRGRYVRPLLSCAPEELRAYLASIGQDWREDETNADVRYARNRVRLRVTPELERACPGASGALARLARAAQRDEDYFDRQIRALALPEPMRLVDGLCVERRALAGLHPALLSRLLVRLCARCGLGAQSADAIEAIASALLEGREATVNLTRGAHAQAGARYLCLTRDEPPPQDAPLKPSGVTDTPFGAFSVRRALPDETGDGRRCQAVPARALSGATVGTRRPGERMRPFGASGHASLGDLMIDAGVERAMRASVPIVRSGGEVLWAVGLRAGAACAAGPGEEALYVEYLGPGVAE